MEREAGKLFVGGISWETNEDRLRDYFQAFGDVTEAVIMKDRNTGRARGFGFIVFADPVVADIVVGEKHVIDGRTVEAKKAIPREDQTVTIRSTGSVQSSPGLVRTKKIFVGGLASTVTENEFKTYFNQFGIITDVVVMYDHNPQRPRGFGFITFDSEEAVEKVSKKTFHELNGKMVEVKRVVPKDQALTPNRNQVGGGYNNFSPGRFSNFLNAYTQGGYNFNLFGDYSMRMDGRFSPITTGRSNGYLPFGLEYEGNGNMRSDIGYARGFSSTFSGNQNRYISPIGYGRVNNGGNGSLLSSPNKNMWGNVSLSYSSNSTNSNDFPYKNIGAIWGGSSNSSGQGTIYRRNSGINVTSTSLLGAMSDGIDGSFGNFNEIGSFYEDLTWRSSFPEQESSFVFGGKMSSDLLATNAHAYSDAYPVTDRADRGIAA